MSVNNLLTILSLSFFISITNSAIGYRPTSILSIPVYQCLTKSKYQFGVISVESSAAGITDVRNIVNAHTAGVNASVIFSPCRGRKPTEQALSFAEKVPRGTFNATVWVYADSYQSGCKWSRNQQAANCQYYKQLTQQLRNYYLLVGIATRQDDWQIIFGGSKCKQLSVLPLLWISPNGDATFEDFVAFSNWRRPQLKQFKEDFNVCGVNLNLEFYPN